MLKAIPIYWHSLVFIPKGILEKIKKMSFRFLWSGKKESEGISLVKWQPIAKPKIWEVGASRIFIILGRH
jgi:hypothetical protein